MLRCSIKYPDGGSLHRIGGSRAVDRGRRVGLDVAVRPEPMAADSIVWAEFAALSGGAAVASKKLWVQRRRETT
jgi:hypothetical protein